ncbi:MAG: hypothetical protein NC311_07695 [Muribaculaceae bacterium]|nr:hypothetical protein [Muribaculaceae bacterium]
MDYKGIKTMIQQWFGPSELLLTWKDEKGNICNLWLELFEGEFVIESQRYATGDNDTASDFDGRYTYFPNLQAAKDALLGFALMASEYYNLNAEYTD